MTAPNGAIKFNNSTGSDTQSSGLGPAVAVYGSGASTTGASAVVTGISTTGVSAGDLLWVQSSSGRQFSIIATVDSSTQVTCDDVFATTESGRTWAIGGKRATFDNADSRTLFSTPFDNSGLLEIKTETSQSLSSTISLSGSTDHEFTKKVYSDDLQTISTTGNFSAFSASQYKTLIVQSIKFLSGSTSSTTAAIDGGFIRASDCVFGEENGSFNFIHGIKGAYYAHGVHIDRCVFFGRGETVSNGSAYRGSHYNGQPTIINDCLIQGFDSGIYNYPNQLKLHNSIIQKCKYGMEVAGGTIFPVIKNVIFHDINSHAIFGSSASRNHQRIGRYDISNLIFSEVSGDLMNFASSSTFRCGGASVSEYDDDIHTNSYKYNCTGGVVNFFPITIQTLTADPFVSAANGNFNLNNAAGGGAVLRSTSYTLGG